MHDLLHYLDWVLPLRSSTATAVFTAFSWTCYTPFILLFFPLGYWAWNKHVFTHLSLFVFVSAVLNSLLKELIQDPRPDAIYRLDTHVGASYGLPSGHAQTAVVLWFGLAYEIRKRWAWYFATVVVIGTCFSRLYLGVHDLEDIIAGALLGALCLCFFRRTVSASWDWWRNLNYTIRIGLVLIVEALIFYLWPGRATPSTLSIGGILFGWFSGAASERIVIRYQPSTTLWRLILSCLLGVASVYVLFVFSQYLGERGSPQSLPFMPFFTSALLGIHITLILPMLYCWFRLGNCKNAGRERVPRETP